MKRHLALLTACAALTACGATLISAAGSGNSRYGPLNDAMRTGVVKYSIDGANFLITRRRNDAYKKMYESCGGPYVIVTEGAREENVRVVSTITDSSSGTTTESGTAVEKAGETRIVSKSADTTQAGSQHTIERVRQTVADHYWYVEYRCATAADTTKY